MWQMPDVNEVEAVILGPDMMNKLPNNSILNLFSTAVDIEDLSRPKVCWFFIFITTFFGQYKNRFIL